MPTPQKRAYAHSTMPMSPGAAAGEDKATAGFLDSMKKKKNDKIVDDYKSALIAENQELQKELNARRMVYEDMQNELKIKKDILRRKKK